jgi:ketosteroid isomerase-like protein
MTEPISRALVEAFYAAYVSRDSRRIGEFLDDDVEWHIAGPVEVMQVCGQWRGKRAVIDRFARVIPQVIDFKRLDRECLLVDGDCSALFGRITCRHIASGRTISHRVAHFARYRSGKVLSLRILNDSLDAAEQYIGHRINLLPEDAPIENDLIAV